MKKFWLVSLCVIGSISFLKAQTSHTVMVSNNVFTPMNVNITVGDTVVWQWVEGTHTTTSDSTTGQNVWDTQIDNSNQVFRYVITTPGVHHYYCIFHQSLGMVGTITAASPTNVTYQKSVPSNFRLAQNYPNPFNPSTVISYSLNKPGFVTLNIYNSVGNEVATLVNENQPAGDYSVVFNAYNGNTRLASGVYFYRLKAGTYDKTLKMLLLK